MNVGNVVLHNEQRQLRQRISRPAAHWFPITPPVVLGESIRGTVLAKRASGTGVIDPTYVTPLPAPTVWPNANARLLGVGAGLPIQPLDRLASFSAKDFERVTLEWADGYLKKSTDVFEIQQRGGSGDKGRDIVAYLDPSSVKKRRWRLYQRKHYATLLSPSTAATEIGKVIHHVSVGSYIPPEEYWFITHRGVSGKLQDLLDDPEKLRAFMLRHWHQHCEGKIAAQQIPLDAELKRVIGLMDFSIFRAKQPLDFINEHAQTKYHLAVFGAPLINRPPPPQPPSAVTPSERVYIEKLHSVIAQALGIDVQGEQDFAHDPDMSRLFKHSRITLYSAEGLKELARDQMADMEYFNTLLADFENGLFYTYTAPAPTGLTCLRATVQAAQSLQIGNHVLEPLATPLDREGFVTILPTMT